MAYVKPQVLVYQEFAATPTAQETTLRAWIVGQNAILHERGENVLGDFETFSGSNIETLIPGLQAGSLVDADSVRVYVDGALLEYANIDSVAVTEDNVDTAVYAWCSVEAPNQLVFNNFNVKENGNHARNAQLGVRDVQVGDIVRITGYGAAIAGTTSCEEVAFDTRVIDYAVTVGNSEILTPVRKTNAYGEYTVTTDLQGAATTAYTGKLAEEIYTVNVNLDAETYFVLSASDTDNTPATAAPIAVKTVNDVENYVFKVGANGVTVTVPAEGFNASAFTVTVKAAAYTVEEGSAFTRIDTDLYNATVNLALSGTYNPLVSGAIKQVYKITATAKNNTTACANIEFRIISESGLDNQYNVQATKDASGNYVFNVTGDGSVIATIAATDFANVNVGDSWAYILTGNYSPATLTVADDAVFTGEADEVYVVTCISGGTVAASGSASVGAVPQIAYTTLSGSDYRSGISVASAAAVVTTGYGVKFYFAAGDLALGETYVIRALSGQNNEVRTLVLQDSLPQELQTGTITSAADIVTFNVKLCIKKDIELTSGIELEGKTLTVDTTNVKVTDSAFTTLTGSLIALSVLSGTVSVAFKELVAAGVGTIQYCDNLDALSAIPGPLTPDNPLKYAVYKALTNSNGVSVAYTNVQDNTPTGWQEAFAAGSGSRDVYTLVPITQDITIQNIAVAAVLQDSNEEICAWKTCMLNTAAPKTVQRVGRDTSLDGSSVTAVMTAKGLVQITSKYNAKANASLEQVKPGDVLRFYTGLNYTEYVIDNISGDTMTVLNPPKDGVAIPSTIEVWHEYTKDEQIEHVASVAQSFANRRVSLLWPDVIQDGAYELPGTMLCAAMAGMVSGILPFQGLTRVSISGFSSVDRSAGYFSETQLNKLAESGVWIVTEDLDGTIYSRHSLTTATGDLLYAEEMVTRNIDDICINIRAYLDIFIGVTNVTSDTMDRIYRVLYNYLERISSSIYSDIGPQLTAYSIISIEQDALLLDRINVVVAGVVPKATNAIEFHIQAS